jgi:amino acid transporter
VLCILSVFCKNGLKTIQIPYIRATNRIDFLILYLALWMEVLSLLAACGALVRTLSTSLDAMTGGLARIYILGRNATDSEPWPDVLGVAIVFLVTGMFMLGLENTKIFSVLMVSGVFGVVTILIIVTWFQGTLTAWTERALFPAGSTKVR